MVVMAVAMAVVAALSLAGIGARDGFAVQPRLHESTRFGRGHTDHHVDAGGRHTLSGAPAHAAGEKELHALRAEPVGPAARLGFGRHDCGYAHDGAAGGIDLEEASLGRAAEVGRELVVLGEGEGDDHKEEWKKAKTVPATGTIQNTRRLEARWRRFGCCGNRSIK
jgi:hypothetical protein